MIAPSEAGHARTRLDPELVAAAAGLRYVSGEEPGIARTKSGTGFRYRAPDGSTIKDRTVRRRVEALGIPPAWTDVWICADPEGHLQATGRDDRGRKQYRYHPRFRAAQDSAKFSRLCMFGASLPKVRARVERDLAQDGLGYDRVLAAAIRILDHHPIRVGNERYARDNDSYGLTTMRDRHVELADDRIEFRFRGKSGKDHRVGIFDDQLAAVVQECVEYPGEELFKYLDSEGARRTIESDDVNEYLRSVSGYDFTAKDFRTWAGTVRTITVLRELGEAGSRTERKRRMVQAVKFVAADLHNTPATCRAFYIHPAVLTAYDAERLEALVEEVGGEAATDVPGLSPEEALALALLPRLEAEFGAG